MFGKNAFCQIESLEARRLRSSVVSGELLKVSGTAKDDVIVIERSADLSMGDRIQVTVNGETEFFDGTLVHDLRVDGRRGDDIIDINLNLRDIRVRGDGGADLIRSSGSGIRAYGGSGNDTLEGGDGSDTLMGGEGDDLLSGGLDRDYLNGGNGNDIIFGGSGADVLRGGAGNDFMRGNGGNDKMFGNGGINEIEGDDGDDMLYAGVDAAGTLIGGMGIDSFNNVNLAMDYDPLVDIDSAPYEIWT